MPDPNFYLVYVDRDPTMSLEDVKKVVDRALDWYRLNPRVWIVYSTSSVEKWYARLKPLAKDGGNVFICKLDTSERQGWMSTEFWRWLHDIEEEKYDEQKA
jgi:hypothetical protein